MAFWVVFKFTAKGKKIRLLEVNFYSQGSHIHLNLTLKYLPLDGAGVSSVHNIELNCKGSYLFLSSGNAFVISSNVH